MRLLGVKRCTNCNGKCSAYSVVKRYTAAVGEKWRFQMGIEDEAQKASEQSIDSDASGMVSAEKVAKLIGKARADTRRQFEDEQAYRDAGRQSQAISNQSTSMGGMAGVDVEKMKRDIYDQIMNEARGAQEKEQQEQHKAAMREVASTYHQKMSAGKDLHADFDEIMGDFDASAFPKLVFLASQLDNAPSVMYELSKNPMKLASIDSLAEKSPAQAMKALKSLGASIQQNQAAVTQNQQANAPLSRMKSSVNAGADSGEASVASFKKMPYLRG